MQKIYISKNRTKGMTRIMNSKKTETFVPDEVFDNWNSMDKYEKIDFLTNPSSETIASLTGFIKEFNKSSERVASLRKDRNDVLIELLKKDDLSFDEKIKIVELIDKGIKESEEANDKGNNQQIKALVIVGGIISIVAGGVVAAKRDKKLGLAMIAAGSAALTGLVGSETKVGKALIDAFSDIQNEEVVDA
jgi:hypothetical protein